MDRDVPILYSSDAGRPAFAALPYDFNLSSTSVTAACEGSRTRAEERLKALAALPPEDATFAKTFVAFSDIVSDLADETAIPLFLGQMAVDKGVQGAGRHCDTKTSQYLVDVYTREGLGKTLKAFAAKAADLQGEDARLVEKTLLDFKRHGLDLSPEDRARVKDLKQRLVSLQNDFAKNLAEEKTTVSFTKEQLAGVPDDLTGRLARDGQMYKVSLDDPDYFPFMENAKDPEARRMLEGKFNSRGGSANVGLLASALSLRAQAARLLGYPDHAAYVLADRMAHDSNAVLYFLQGLKKKLDLKAKPELGVLAALKKEESGAKSDGIIHAWDWRYYHHKLLRTRYEVDDQKIKEYFPADVVTAGLLKVYQTLLGLRFVEVSPAGAWHEDVKLYAIKDAAAEDGPRPRSLQGTVQSNTEEGDGDAFAYFFMDLYSREGKYKHAAAFTLAPGRRLPDGRYQKPVSAIVLNLNKATAGRPSLLTHDEVETFFHEFGRIMHQTLTKARYERFSGSNVARDFVEAPSQMMEEWVWQEDVLKSLSGHYKDKTQTLPAALLKKMIAARNVDSGLATLRQVFLATLDLTYHTEPVSDLTKTYGKLSAEVSLIPMSEGTAPEAGFGRLMGGYDAGCYGTLWSKVYAEDMFSRFQEGGVLDPVIGRDYRRQILEPGGSRDEDFSLRAFLGRGLDNAPFLKSIGL